MSTSTKKSKTNSIYEKYNKLPEANLKNTKIIAKENNHDFIIKLNYNENKFNATPRIRQQIKIVNPHIYPEINDLDILQIFKQDFKIKPENIFFSNGSDAILDHLPKIFAFTKSNPNVIIPALTYSRIEITCSIVNLEIKKIDLNSKWEIDLDKTLKAIDKNTTLIYLVNPNMPTGLYYEHKEIIKFLNKIPKDIFVVLDEAYIEYAEKGNIERTYKNDLDLINKFENLIITRTFSKWYAIASFRIGYCLSNEKNISIIKKTHQYLPVSKYSYQAATIALNERKYYNYIYKKFEKEKEKLYKFFSSINFNYLQTNANFIYIYNCNFNIDKLINFLISKHGILIRKIKDFGIRITIGTPQENKILIKGIKEFFK